MSHKFEDNFYNAIYNSGSRRSAAIPVVFIVLMVIVFLAANSNALFGFDVTAIFGW